MWKTAVIKETQSAQRLAVICLLLASYSGIADAGAKPEDIVAHHLESIGTAEARAAVKSRGIQGTLKFRIVTGGAGESGGSWQRLSEERKSRFVMKFGDTKWWGEQFVFDGDKASCAAATLSHQRSPLGGFVASQDSLIKEGLLNGELGTAWALENLDHHVRLDYMGRKKINGRELDGIEYISKNNGVMTVKLYFEPETHHHVMTVYSIARGASITSNDVSNARQQEIHYILEERFGDFQTDNGITLPRQYDLRFTQQLQSGTTTVYDWTMTADKVLENPNIDASNFQIK